jgi:hypothetical protein
METRFIQVTYTAGVDTSASQIAAALMRERYLDELCAKLPVDLSQEGRAEIRRELEIHLDALIEARREMGETESEALAKALTQFGAVPMIAQEWKEQTPPFGWARLTGLATASVIFTLTTILFSILTMVTINWGNPSSNLVIALLLGPLIPLSLGALWSQTHRRTPRKYGLPFLAGMTSLAFTALSPMPFDWAPVPIVFDNGTELGAMLVKAIWSMCHLSVWLIVTLSVAGLGDSVRQLAEGLKLRERMKALALW